MMLQDLVGILLQWGFFDYDVSKRKEHIITNFPNHK